MIRTVLLIFLVVLLFTLLVWGVTWWALSVIDRWAGHDHDDEET